MRKGDVALIASVLLYAAGWIVYANFNAHAGEVIRMAGEASLIGGLCDYIALKMLFERKWYLPNSGVLPRNRARIIQGIGNAVENEWLTPEMIHRKLTEYDLVTKIGRLLEQLSLRDADLTFVEEQALRLAEWLKRPEVVDRMVEELRKLLEFGPLLRMVERLLVNFEGKLRNFAQTLPELVSKFSHDPEFLQYLEDEIHRVGVKLQTADSIERNHVLEWMEKLINAAVGASRGEITRLVVENLSRKTDEQIRVQIESKTRTHLEWIRVNGSLFGALFGLCAAFLRSSIPWELYAALTRSFTPRR
ncbi:MAG TPA: DUF445 family protein [Candidatus Binataceae bacterium]|nr:DUF445 family protein [Candidatus Binataceae bacterium]